MIAEIIKFALQIIAEWPQRRAEGFKRSWASWRAGYEKRAEDRARRAALVESNDILRKKDKLS